MNFKALALTTLVALTGFAGAVEARPHRTICDTLSGGDGYCISPEGSIGVNVIWHNKIKGTGFEAVGNCRTGKVFWKNRYGFTRSQVTRMVHAACDF